MLRLATRNSGLELACGMEHLVTNGRATSAAAAGDGAALTVEADLAPGRPLALEQPTKPCPLEPSAGHPDGVLMAMPDVHVRS